MERRDELLRAAARVYARHGYRGSTTRRIADEAGVNEITIFRQFGTKDTLIHEAIASCGMTGPLAELPAIPTDPHRELKHWAMSLRSHICASRLIMRRCMSEREEHPQLNASANRGPLRAAAELRSYIERLREHGFTDGIVDAKAASAMFLGTLFSDAMGRDTMPDIYPSPPAAAVDHYTTLILAALGVPAPSPASSPTTSHSR
ncbi:MAG: TetR/AcrR family transcriptional regulator [Gemmatimonadota bacterium]|nr:TetR/AcrR family transcriptional regulator [Gemmatimonadota bacterium]